MSFVYSKPLSMEQVFALYNSKGGDDIDETEASDAKNIKIFQGFVVEKGMKFEDFARVNEDVYRQYEEVNSEAWAKSVLNNKYSTDAQKEEANKTLERIAQNTYNRAKTTEHEASKGMKPKFGIDEE